MKWRAARGIAAFQNSGRFLGSKPSCGRFLDQKEASKRRETVTS